MPKIKYFGHACFYLKEKQWSVLIDPYLKGNPMVNSYPVEIKPNLILVTHGHSDHLGDAIEISQQTETPILTTFELANYCTKKGAKTIGAHMGGTVRFEFGFVKIVPAWHSSSSEDGIYTGTPCGFIIRFGETTIYHAGDTCVFGDMHLMAQITPIDIAILPIGGHYTMDPEEAIKAVELINPRLVIPMHYNTFDIIKQDAKAFQAKVEVTGIKCLIIQPGEEKELFLS